MSKSILCIGACHIDYKFIAEDDIVLETSNPIKSLHNYGGVIRNVAENLSLLKVNVSLMSLVGNDFMGKQLVIDTGKIMNVDFIKKSDEHATGQYYAVVNVNGNVDVAYADMTIYDLMVKEWILERLGNYKDFDWIVADMNVQKSGLEALISLNKVSENKLAIIGVSGPKMKYLPKDLDGVDLIICNKDETMTYFNTQETDLEYLCSLWLAKGVQEVVVTSGKDDVFYASNNYGIRSKKVMQIDSNKIKDVTGAGDSFSGGVLFGLVNEYSLDDSVLFGLANASRTIQVEDSVRRDLTNKILIEEVKDYE